MSLSPKLVRSFGKHALVSELGCNEAVVNPSPLFVFILAVSDGKPVSTFPKTAIAPQPRPDNPYQGQSEAVPCHCILQMVVGKIDNRHATDRQTTWIRFVICIDEERHDLIQIWQIGAFGHRRPVFPIEDILGLALWMEVNVGPPLWVHFILWVPLAIILSLVAMRWAKGILINIQYRNKAALGRIDSRRDDSK